MARKATHEERALWHHAISDVAPKRRRPAPPPASPASAPVPPDPPEPRPAMAPAVPLGTGLDRRNAQRLKRGQMAIEARLDLHGMTQAEAHGALARFVSRSFDDGRRAVLVITGKGARDGKGVLRHAVPRWLAEPALRPMILAREEAQPRHGGGGALYVLLRRKRS
jgi:DNA-nicking Smr family endonuclease